LKGACGFGGGGCRLRRCERASEREREGERGGGDGARAAEEDGLPGN